MKTLSFEEYIHLFGEKIVEIYFSESGDKIIITKNWKNRYKLYTRKQYYNSKNRLNDFKLKATGKKEINKFMLENKLVKIS